MLIHYLSAALIAVSVAMVGEPPGQQLLVKPDAFATLVNPNCSHCVDEAKRRAGDLRFDDPVLCWTRGYSDGGVIPIRFFLNRYRVISDSYGVFVYDPDAGYARGFVPSYNFSFHGWRNGIMVMKHKDGSLYSCLSGLAFEGPRKGERLQTIPTAISTWGEWIKHYPHAVAYHMFDKYQAAELPTAEHPDSLRSRLTHVDSRLDQKQLVLGVVVGEKAQAYPLDKQMSLMEDSLNGEKVVILRHGSSAAAYKAVASQARKFKAPQPDKEGVSPPDKGTLQPPGAAAQPARMVHLREADGTFVDTETGSHWDVAGRAVDGELKGWTLEPVDAVVCRWFAWSAEYPQTDVFQAVRQKEMPDGKANEVANTAMKMIAGTAEFLRLLPKPFAIVRAIDAKNRTVTLQLDGENMAKVWPVEPDAEVKIMGWWGRLEQFKPGDHVWCWLKLDRQKKPVSVVMLADSLSEFDFHGCLHERKSESYSAEEIERKRNAQKDWLRERWQLEGLPGTLTFQHIFSGELEVMLDHEAMRWGRSLNAGDIVFFNTDPQIKAVAKEVMPWRERTLVRLVVGELESSELKPGQRIALKMTPPAKTVDDSLYPPDIGHRRTTDQRIEWFLASSYCVCGINRDTCTGQFYTLASCNPNGCGSPNATRKKINQLIERGKTDREIWDELSKDSGPLMNKPHLSP